MSASPGRLARAVHQYSASSSSVLRAGRARLRSLRFWICASPTTLPLATLVLLLADEALARPGGGQSYSGGGSSSRGGGSSSGGGSSGGGDGLAQLLIYLCFEHPIVGIPLTFGALYYMYRFQKTKKSPGWSTMIPVHLRAPPPTPASARRVLLLLRERDRNFSIVVLEEFLYALYFRVHEARGDGTLETLAAYVAPAARAALASKDLCAVRGIIIGRMSFDHVDLTDPARVRLSVTFESNLTEQDAAGRAQGWYRQERWLFSRPRDVLSREPSRARTIDCPACGAPLADKRGSTCAHCGKNVDEGGFDWRLEQLQLLERVERPPALTSQAEERGAELPTQVDPDLAAQLDEMRLRDPAFTREAFEARVALVFGELQLAWSACDWKRSRPFLSEGLFQAHLGWYAAYEEAGLRNLIEGPRLHRIDLVQVSSDRFFDAITVRIFAASGDVTVRQRDGALVAGRRGELRRYTEYWTLIRGRGRTGTPSTTTLACPSCGAPLEIEMAGACVYCQAKVTSGEFDWVLSRVEQDEAFRR